MTTKSTDELLEEVARKAYAGNVRATVAEFEAYAVERECSGERPSAANLERTLTATMELLAALASDYR